MAKRSAERRRALKVTVTGRTGRPARAPGLARWLESVAPARACGAVAVALVSDRDMRRMNRAFAGVNGVTDVLSFPAVSEVAGGRRAGRAGRTARLPRESAVLGDIVIARERAARQARRAGHAVGTELRVLALHGLLHLIGYDHHADGGEMARLERRLGRRGGLGEGLIGRTAT